MYKDHEMVQQVQSRETQEPRKKEGEQTTVKAITGWVNNRSQSTKGGEK